MTEDFRSQRGDRAPGDQRQHEASDLDARGAGLTMGALAAMVVIVCVLVAGLFLWFGTIRQPPALRPPHSAAPPLQTDEPLDRRAIEARARARLAGIDEAMRQTAVAGWDGPR